MMSSSFLTKNRSGQQSLILPTNKETMSQHRGSTLWTVGISSAVTGVVLTLAWQRFAQKKKADPETDPQVAHSLVWNSIGGAMNAAMLYTGDHLHLYTTLRDMCSKPGSFVTAITLAEETVILFSTLVPS
jgi:hypothetical protein